MVDRANVCVIRKIDTGCVLGNDVVDIDLFTGLERRTRFGGHGLVKVLDEFFRRTPDNVERSSAIFAPFQELI